MKCIIISFITLCLAINGFAQDINDYYAVDRTMLGIPVAQTHTTTDIAAFVKAHFDTESKKVRGIYTWVAVNIRYNSDSINPIVFEEDRELRIASTLRRKKGVCENYATIFHDICSKSGLKSLLIEGYTKQHGSVDRSPHEWCTVFVHGNWLLYDPTWDENIANNGRLTGNLDYHYFQVPPESFIDSHIPFDPMFQLLNYPVTYNQFFNGQGPAKNIRYFNYADSLAADEKLTPLEKSLSAAARIQTNGPANSMVSNRLNKLKMDIEIIYQDKDTTLYNGAVADYNNALAVYNVFINFRNNRFTPSKTDIEIAAIFESIKKSVAAANTKLAEVNASRARLTLNTFPLQKVTDDLSTHLKEQEDFIKEYFSSGKIK